MHPITQQIPRSEFIQLKDTLKVWDLMITNNIY